jgi:Na+/proline symporter
MNQLTPTGLHPIDWTIILLYLALSMGVGFLVKGEAEANKESYFLAGRSLPWWWAGLSIAATTFAADTPLAITGLIAAKGISGNWLWLAWMGAHAAVVVLFARGWSRSGVLTDAEIVSLRYSGKSARFLRWFRAGLSGVVINCIVLGWVLRAMSKIGAPFFHWDQWVPGLISLMENLGWTNSPLGTPSEALTVFVLLGIVALYSSLGGIRGVILTDLVQLSVALIGSTWLAWNAWMAVGGRVGLVTGLRELYGPNHLYLDLFPTLGAGWVGKIEVGAFVLGLYFLVQSYANVSPDGGGYMMQRLNSTKNQVHARGAALLFMVIHYLVRIWPWFVVALAALVLIPIGQEQTAMGGAAALVAGDRQLAYPVLMRELLVPGALGLMVTSMLAAFMSTVDTHLNWGASYMVNDVYLQLYPDAPIEKQIRVARTSVFVYVALAVLICFQIESLAEAWGWVACLGASLATPTVLRWVWWRVNAAAEITAMVFGLSVGSYLILFQSPAIPYEKRLVIISAVSLVGMLVGIFLGPSTDFETLQSFVARVRPVGFWPGRSPSEGLVDFGATVLRWLAVLGGVLAMLTASHRALLFGQYAFALKVGSLGLVAFLWGGLSGADMELLGEAKGAP